MNADYIDANVFYPSNPVGIDAEILKIQRSFAVIPWLEKVFGRCTVQIGRFEVSDTNRKREVIYPECYQANNEPVNMMPNDNFKSYCFFNVEDPAQFQDYEAFNNQQNLSRKISIIFWCNQRKINPAQTGRFNENLILEVINILGKHSSFTPDNIYESYQEVFKGFSITEEYRQFMKLPFTAFRITGDFIYSIYPSNC